MPRLTELEKNSLLACALMVAAGEPPDGELSDKEWNALPKAIEKLKAMRRRTTQ